VDAEPRTIAYVVRSFPRLSQTFILNEVLALAAERIAGLLAAGV